MSIFVMNKLLGETPLEALERLRKTEGIAPEISMTYAGRLDPMATGALLILTGDDVHQKDQLLQLPKTYKATIVFGAETDTYDALGLITATSHNTPSQEQAEKALLRLSGVHSLPYPPFSSKPVAGKPLFEWVREGRIQEIDIPKKEMEFSDIQLLSYREIPANTLVNSIIKDIANVNGDFRQEDIIRTWKSATLPNQLPELTFSITCSSGSYVRSLAHEAGKHAGSGAFLRHLERTSIGKYKAA